MVLGLREGGVRFSECNLGIATLEFREDFTGLDAVPPGHGDVGDLRHRDRCGEGELPFT